MDPRNDTVAADAFIEAAASRGFLTEPERESLRRDAARSPVGVAQLAVESGLMTAAEAEIAEAFVTPNDLAPGFRVIDVLGYGALGVVYRAEQPRLRREVAIKSIMPDRIRETNVLARFQQEGAAIGRLQHPNIVSAYDSGTHKHRFYLVMELVRGIDLRRRLDERGPLETATAVSIARQVASGLDHALSQGIIHRDIKPGNLILTDAATGFGLPDGVPLVKIADFGLARLTSQSESEDATQLTMAGSALGTPMYCAPEQLSGDPVDHRADIYALGTTLLHMVSGQPPYPNKKVSRLIAEKLGGNAYDLNSLPADFPVPLRVLIDRMTTHDPDDRIGDYGTVIRALDALAEQLHPSEERATRFAKTAALVAVGGAMLLCLAVVLSMPNLFATPQPSYQRTFTEQPLFSGTNVEPWKTRRGLWKVGQDSENAAVLAGRGVASYDLEADADVTPRESFAFRVAVGLQDAEAAEIQFGFQRSSESDGPRLVVRYTAAGLVLGRREGNDGPLQVLAEHTAPPPPIDDDGPVYHSLYVERHDETWFVFLDGELKPFGHADADPDAESLQFQLVAIGGEVYFSDIALIELRKRGQGSGS